MVDVFRPLILSFCRIKETVTLFTDVMVDLITSLCFDFLAAIIDIDEFFQEQRKLFES